MKNFIFLMTIVLSTSAFAQLNEGLVGPATRNEGRMDGKYDTAVIDANAVEPSAPDDFYLEKSDKNPMLGMSYYPSPFENVLNIENPSMIRNVRITNIYGQQLLSQEVRAHEAHLDVSFLSNGSYTLEVETDNKFEYRKIVKQ